MKTDPATPLPECHEGQEAFQRFDSLADSVLAVPHSLLKRRERIVTVFWVRSLTD
jgi:hypothetical protein